MERFESMKTLTDQQKLTEVENTAQVIAQTSLITALSFNRDMESESDQEALIILEKIYGHTGAADAFFLHMLENKSQPRWAEICFTHPDVEKRIKAIQKINVPTQVILTPLDQRLTLYLQENTVK